MTLLNWDSVLALNKKLSSFFSAKTLSVSQLIKSIAHDAAFNPYWTPPVLYLIELLVYFLLYNFSCDAIAEEDENEVDSALLANGVGPGGDLTTMSEERKAAALRIIRRAKRAGLARDRAYSTSEGGTNNHLPNLLNGVGGTLGGPHNRQQRNGDKNSRKSRSGFGRGLPKKGT